MATVLINLHNILMGLRITIETKIWASMCVKEFLGEVKLGGRAYQIQVEPSH